MARDASSAASHRSTDSPATSSEAPSQEGTLATQNSSGRSGAFFLPAGFNLKARPLLVAFHGTDESGGDMVGLFRGLASTRSFIIVAPDARLHDGHYNWEVGTNPHEVTEDYTHTLACIAEVRARPGVKLDQDAFMALGVSGGGSSAPYLATNETMFDAFAVLHGGVLQGGIGQNVVRGWFSTGESDPARPPSLVQQSVDYMKGLGFSDVTFTLYTGDHAVSTTEASDVIGWWLDR